MDMDMYSNVALTWTFIIVMNIQHWHTVVVLDMKKTGNKIK
jgi:hypothetical protein